MMPGNSVRINDGKTLKWYLFEAWCEYPTAENASKVYDFINEVE